MRPRVPLCCVRSRRGCQRQRHATPLTEAGHAATLLAKHGLISTEALAAHYGITPAAVRKLMSDHHIGVVRGYPADQALNIDRPGRHPAPGPGRGHRKNTTTHHEPPATTTEDRTPSSTAVRCTVLLMILTPKPPRDSCPCSTHSGVGGPSGARRCGQQNPHGVDQFVIRQHGDPVGLKVGHRIAAPPVAARGVVVRPAGESAPEPDSSITTPRSAWDWLWRGSGHSKCVPQG